MEVLSSDSEHQILQHIKDVQDENSMLKEENALFRKKFSQIQHEISLTRKQHARFEQVLTTREQEVNELRVENVSLQRGKREAERAADRETKQLEKQSVEWQTRENSLLDRIRTLESHLVRAQDEVDAASAEAAAAKATANGAAMDDALAYLREARAAQRELKDKDRLIQELRIEMENLKLNSSDLVDQFQQQQLKVAHLENELQQAQEVNNGLVSDCESYQRLLQKKTMDGTFALKKKKAKGLDLNAELNRAFASAPAPPEPTTTKPMSREKHLERQVDELSKELQESRNEVASLSLYVNRILARIMETNQPEMLASNEEEFRGERRRKSLQPGEQVAAPSSESGFEALKKHFRRASVVKKEEEDSDSTPEIKAAAAAMVERMRGMQTESVEEKKEEEGGIWRKALKRMSVGTWRSPTPQQATLGGSRNASEVSLAIEKIEEESEVPVVAQGLPVVDEHAEEPQAEIEA